MAAQSLASGNPNFRVFWNVPGNIIRFSLDHGPNPPQGDAMMTMNGRFRRRYCHKHCTSCVLLRSNPTTASKFWPFTKSKCFAKMQDVFPSPPKISTTSTPWSVLQLLVALTKSCTLEQFGLTTDCAASLPCSHDFQTERNENTWYSKWLCSSSCLAFAFWLRKVFTSGSMLHRFSPQSSLCTSYSCLRGTGTWPAFFFSFCLSASSVGKASVSFFWSLGKDLTSSSKLTARLLFDLAVLCFGRRPGWMLLLQEEISRETMGVPVLRLECNAEIRKGVCSICSSEFACETSAVDAWTGFKFNSGCLFMSPTWDASGGACHPSAWLPTCLSNELITCLCVASLKLFHSTCSAPCLHKQSARDSRGKLLRIWVIMWHGTAGQYRHALCKEWLNTSLNARNACKFQAWLRTLASSNTFPPRLLCREMMRDKFCALALSRRFPEPMHGPWSRTHTNSGRWLSSEFCKLSSWPLECKSNHTLITFAPSSRNTCCLSPWTSLMIQTTGACKTLTLFGWEEKALPLFG